MIPNSIYNKVKEGRNLICTEGNSEEEKVISENIPCLINNSIGMLGWSENIIHDDDLSHSNDRNGIFSYNFYNNNADDMFQSEEKIGCQEMQGQIISSKFLLDSENKANERNQEISNIQTQCCSNFPSEKINLNRQISNYSSSTSSVSIYNVTDTVFKEMRSEGTSEPKDISRYMDNELLKVWCMEMCPEEYLDAGYPLGSLLWVSTLDIESHIKKWRYRGKKSNGQFEYITPKIHGFEERALKKNPVPEVSLLTNNTERNMNEENLQINSNQVLEDLNLQKRDFIEDDGCIDNSGINNVDCVRSSSSSECNDSAAEMQALNQGSIFCKSTKKSRGRGRPKSKPKQIFFEEEEHEFPRKRMFLSEEGENNSSIITNEKFSERSQDESIEELELELGMEFEQASSQGYSSNFIWDLVRSIPIESLNRLYVSWLDGNIPGVTKLIVKSSVVQEYLNIQKNVENSRLEESSDRLYNCKETNSDILNKKQTSEVINSKRTILYHKALYLAIQQHLLMYSSELQALLKALEGNNTISERDTDHLDPFHKNLDVVLNSISPLQHLSMSFHCNSPLRIVEEGQIDDEEHISREAGIRSCSEEKLIHGCDSHNDSNISRDGLVDDNGESLIESQNLTETPRLGNNMHDSSSVFSIITSAQYQDFVELPDIASSFSDQLLSDHTELSKHCANMGEPIDLFFAIS
ncbi:hypothetical predicted AT hook motif protein, unknown function [Cryptosporidium parvum]|uniref:Uncharacterized protein n=1 Tax=Cryptosporidium parvum TaxID=5807 RepID=A0A7G2HKH7_CRYPV|nr:hypothetical predicted AT hook motif protein, unknown function [Cryptosporidium parvum]